MKKQLIIIGIIVILLVVGLSGCTGDDDKSSAAKVMSEDFVRTYFNYPSSCEFDFWGRSATSCGSNCWTITGSVMAQNAFGTKIKHYYTIDMIYLGGDDVDISNWDYKNCRVWQE
jgi:hypothetical protein